jgi:hypothetical protein
MRATAFEMPGAPLVAPDFSEHLRTLIEEVEDEFRRRGDPAPDPEVVRTLAVFAAGYRKGPAADPPFDVPFDIDERVAEAVVERYLIGARPDIERRDRVRDVRTWVGFNVAQLGLGDVGETARKTLASLALGLWNPLSERNEPKPIVDYVVARYRDGLS